MTLTVQQFEQILTQRVLLDKIPRNSSRPYYRLVYSNAFYTANEILRDYGLNESAWAIRRGERLYLVYPPTRRIICEIGVIADPAVEFRVITLKGFVSATETLESLIQATANRGMRQNAFKFRERNKDEQHH